MPDDRKVLRFWEWTNFDDEQEDFYSNPLEEGRSLKGYFIAQKKTHELYANWSEGDSQGLSGALIDPKYTSTDDQSLFFRENLSQQFRSYYIANANMADYYETVSYTHLTLPTNREV